MHIQNQIINVKNFATRNKLKICNCDAHHIPPTCEMHTTTQPDPRALTEHTADSQESEDLYNHNNNNTQNQNHNDTNSNANSHTSNNPHSNNLNNNQNQNQKNKNDLSTSKNTSTQHNVINKVSNKAFTKIPYEEDPDYSYINTKPIYLSYSNFETKFAINIGSNAGVRVGNIITTTDNKLCGRIVQVNQNNAIALFITDINFRIPVILKHNNLNSIAMGSSTLNMQLKYIDNKDLKYYNNTDSKNDIIITAGELEKVPYGIKVGILNDKNGSPHAKSDINIRKINNMKLYLFND